MASTSKNSGLHRSRSSSCIPLAQRLSVRPPLTSNKGSVQKSRPKSTVRQGQEKLSLDRNLRRSSSTLNINDVSRLSRQRSGSLVRLTTSTPLSIRSARKSPLLSSARKDNRPISDKRWQYEQIVKVRNFVASEFPHLDYNNVKSGMPLELFVALMDSYFKLIDKRIKITRENYVEEVPLNLKRYHYPASIKPSLMKTVNTPHSWPHVVGILSWLTDVIYEINNPPIESESDLDTLSNNCCMELYWQWSRCQDETEDIDDPLQELDLKIVEMLDIDDNAFKQSQHEISTLTSDISAYKEKKKLAMNTIDELQLNIQTLNSNCDTYLTESQGYEANLNDQFAKYTEKIKIIDQELVDFSKTEEELKSVIASQPHSHVEYEQLSEIIKSLQSTIKLKEERCEQQRLLIYKYDLQLSDIKQKVEASAFKYNNMINQLELHNPELNKLHVREHGFARSDTENGIQRVQEILTKTIKTLKLETERCSKEKTKCKKKRTETDADILTEKGHLEQIESLQAEAEIEYQHQVKNMEQERDEILLENSKYKKKSKDLEKARFDLSPLKVEMKNREERKIELLNFRSDLKSKALNFFIQLDTQIYENNEHYMNSMERSVVAMISAQDKAIAESKTRIEKLEKEREQAESLQSNLIKISGKD